MPEATTFLFVDVCLAAVTVLALAVLVLAVLVLVLTAATGAAAVFGFVTGSAGAGGLAADVRAVSGVDDGVVAGTGAAAWRAEVAVLGVAAVVAGETSEARAGAADGSSSETAQAVVDAAARRAAPAATVVQRRLPGAVSRLVGCGE
ncbi:hypothetical protein GCM10010149_65010 [Nonomuraea roseoviolacea subsp. roseoviolacea]